jgi:hypothetical protein
MKGMIEIEHEIPVVVSRDLNEFIERVSLAVCLVLDELNRIEIGIDRSNVRILVKGFREDFEMVGIVKIVIPQVRYVFSSGPLESLVKSEGKAPVDRIVIVLDPTVIKLTDDIPNIHPPIIH